MAKATSPKSDNSFELAYVNTKSVNCNGGSTGLGHPLIYLTMDAGKDQVICPYCSKTFVYRSKN